MKMNRRTALQAGAALAAAAAIPAWAQAKPTIRFAAVFSDKDIRADMVRMLAKEVGNDFTIETFFNARSEERRVGKECERLCRSRWSPYH